ncbi:uracil-DNA glycosylase [Basilea psittacipulmonis]|uniref:Uracil-DNA glycosylase n=1 Tax=Basilea psittacipulmonis DSM 24701 TaxID=1072685 RepID=A0A077DH52_9BURK|nr:uracil-DNA glycosylase [Basilea psittacipulmonis]AIL32498.1 uracil-DNA glycosylase [Basilea psittacipulmonis DSM 24701]
MQNWNDFIYQESQQDYYRALMSKIDEARLSQKAIFPEISQVFHAFELTPFDKVKVVILGQDPYHGVGQAHGLAFSVKPHVPIPPSLQNIYKELSEDISGFTIPDHGCLTDWAKQGVLLLNAVLTVEQDRANSHANWGWEVFTDHVIASLNREREHLVFVLWGKYAQKKGQVIDETKHLVIRSAHPSPLSAYRGFFGSKPFSQINQYLVSQGISPINWQI